MRGSAQLATLPILSHWNAGAPMEVLAEPTVTMAEIERSAPRQVIEPVLAFPRVGELLDVPSLEDGPLAAALSERLLATRA